MYNGWRDFNFFQMKFFFRRSTIKSKKLLVDELTNCLDRSINSVFSILYAAYGMLLLADWNSSWNRIAFDKTCGNWIWIISFWWECHKPELMKNEAKQLSLHAIKQSTNNPNNPNSKNTDCYSQYSAQPNEYHQLL